MEEVEKEFRLRNKHLKQLAEEREEKIKTYINKCRKYKKLVEQFKHENQKLVDNNAELLKSNQ